MKVIAVATQKGGEGKTTTAAALAAGLALKGYRVLSVDMDSQKSLTYIMAGNADGLTVLDLLTESAATSDAIQHTPSGDLIAGDKGLSQIDTVLRETIGRPYKLKKALSAIEALYDYVIVDTPPALSTLTANALTAADMVVIPVQPDVSGLQGIVQVWETINEAREYTNPGLQLAGILLTRYNDRTTLNKDIRQQLEEQLAPALRTKVFRATIRDAVAVREAKYQQQPLFTYAPTANVTNDYREFIDELLSDREE